MTMINLFNADSGAPLGAISEEQLAFLVASMEEESDDDQDYYLDVNTLDYLEARGAEAGLLKLLKSALGQADSVSVRWTRE
jgi:processive 1,2-diacylglycerol beta-glucosyltransferase